MKVEPPAQIALAMLEQRMENQQMEACQEPWKQTVRTPEEVGCLVVQLKKVLIVLFHVIQ
jgi:hypothetical protein